MYTKTAQALATAPPSGTMSAHVGDIKSAQISEKACEQWKKFTKWTVMQHYIHVWGI